MTYNTKSQIYNAKNNKLCPNSPLRQVFNLQKLQTMITVWSGWPILNRKLIIPCILVQSLIIWRDFTACFGIHAFGHRKWTDLDEMWSILSTLHYRGLATADFGCDLHSSDNWLPGEILFLFFCQVRNARFHWFPIGQHIDRCRDENLRNRILKTNLP